MHDRCLKFVSDITKRVDFNGRRVLEIGSKNVNGSVKPLFSGSDYYGIDLLPGKDVDEVIGAQYFDGRESFDYVVSTEAMEHTPFPEEIAECAYRSLRSDGRFIVTAASNGREPHRADGEPGDPRENGEFYENISLERMSGILRSVGFMDIEVHQVEYDVQGIATKP